MSLLTDQDSDRDADLPKVTLMTIHSAKGLEFRNVFVVGLEENLFRELQLLPLIKSWRKSGVCFMLL